MAGDPTKGKCQQSDCSDTEENFFGQKMTHRHNLILVASISGRASFKKNTEGNFSLSHN